MADVRPPENGEHAQDVLLDYLDRALGVGSKSHSLQDAHLEGSDYHATADGFQALLVNPIHWINQAIIQDRAAAVSCVVRSLQQLGWQPTPVQLESLARTPINQQEHVQALVDEGVLPKYPQILAAAAEGVEGVRLWAVACAAAGLPPPEGMPAGVAALCCGQELQGGQAAQVDAEVCLFALDCEQCTPEQLQEAAAGLNPDQLQQVLLAAIKRHRFSVLAELYSVPAVDQLNSQQLVELLWQQFESMPVHGRFPPLPARVFQEGVLPAAAVAELVGRVQQQQQQAAAEDQGAPSAAHAWLLWQLLQLPAALALTQHAQAAAEHLAAAMVTCKPQGDDMIVYKLPPGVVLTGDLLLPLLYAAVQLGWRGQIQYLCTLPGAKQLGPEQLLGLMQAAAALDGGLPHLVQLPAAAALTVDHLLPLLTALVQLGRWFEFKCVAQLSGARQLTPQEVLGLMHASAAAGGDTLEYIVQMPAVKLLPGEQLLPLLAGLVQQGKEGEVELLCRLPGAQQLTADHLVSLMLAAANDRPRAVQHLLALPAALSLSGEQLLLLLQSRTWEDTTRDELCWLGMANSSRAARKAGALGLPTLPSGSALRQLLAQRPTLAAGLVALSCSTSNELAAAWAEKTLQRVVASCGALLRLADSKLGAVLRPWEGVGSQPGLVESLVQLLHISSAAGSSCPHLQPLALQSLVSLIDSRAARIQGMFDHPGTLEALLSLLTPSSDAGDGGGWEMQKQAARALGLLAGDSPAALQRVLDTPGALEGLVAVLGNSSSSSGSDGNSSGSGGNGNGNGASGGAEEVQKQAARALAHMAATSPPCCHALVEIPGALETFVTLLSPTTSSSGSSSSGDLQKQAARMLLSISEHTEGGAQHVLATPGALEGLVSLLGNNSSDGARLVAAACIGTLAAEAPEEKEELGAQPGLLEGMVGFLNPNSSSSSTVSSSRSNAGGPSRRNSSCSIGSSASSNMANQLQRVAAKALGNLTAGCPVNQQRLADTPGALEAVVALLGSSDKEVQEKSANTLFNITADSAVCTKRVLESLVRLLQGSTTNPDAQWSAAACIIFMANKGPEQWEYIGAQPGLLEGLVVLLGGVRSSSGSSSTGVKLQHVAAWILDGLAISGPTNQQRITATPGAVAGLVGLLTSIDREVLEKATSALLHIAGGGPSSTEGERSTPRVQEEAQPADSNASSSDAMQQILVSCPDVLTQISGLLSRAEESVRTSAEQLASCLLNRMASHGKDTTVAAATAAVVPGLQALASSGHEDLQRLAQQLLTGLSEP